eukprot:Blabericola_migrator_1__10423@NODE_5897_length_647_cov_2_596552_g3900_i0_p1_GENE_NODE_5897_length_647_cov_2_596552_g3900_i0NODE_5897_length_647_cov_2_596552_g3900_i0_p1_ORF_typecomplete_len213_score65_03_NODE_5897_length_647_cov_2_596552_g3900_i07645
MSEALKSLGNNLPESLKSAIPTMTNALDKLDPSMPSITLPFGDLSQIVATLDPSLKAALPQEDLAAALGGSPVQKDHAPWNPSSPFRAVPIGALPAFWNLTNHLTSPPTPEPDESGPGHFSGEPPADEVEEPEAPLEDLEETPGEDTQETPGEEAPIEEKEALVDEEAPLDDDAPAAAPANEEAPVEEEASIDEEGSLKTLPSLKTLNLQTK